MGKILNQFGQPAKAPRKRKVSGKAQALGQYPSVYQNPGKIRVRYYTPEDTIASYTASNRTETIKYARSLFAQMPTLHGAVRLKAQYCTQNAFVPSFRGTNTAWGNEAENWLLNRFFPVCNVAGGNYNFFSTLATLSIALDVDGEALIILTNSRNGFPLIQVVRSHRIGTRDYNEKEAKTGRYKGNRIVDGVIIDSNNRPLAYRVLGDTEDEDYDVPAQSAFLLFDPEYTDNVRGISRFAPTVLNALYLQDIDAGLMRQVSLDSSEAMKVFTKDGFAPPSMVSPGVFSETTSSTDTTRNCEVKITPVFDGMYRFLQADTGEDIQPFASERPSPNVVEFTKRLERAAMESIGWKYEMLDSSAVGGPAVRLVQNEVRMAIRSRQDTLTRAAKFIVAFAIVKAMQGGLISDNTNGDWYNFTFNRGQQITIDSGIEREADRKDYLLGLITAQEIAAKNGQDIEHIREQQTKEARDLLTRAKELATEFDISLDKAIDLLSQRSANPVSIAEPDKAN